MENSPKEESKAEGLRERKRRETLRRIAEQGLKLFLTNGFEATTLDQIAEAAGISRRTFFYYFRSKEDILMAWQGGAFAETVQAAVLEQSTKQSPFDAVTNALLALATRFQPDPRQARAIDRLMGSTEQLRVRHQAKYIEQEQAVFEALCKMWPQPRRQPALRMVAMMAIGAFRLGVDGWLRDEGRRPIATCLKEAFANLKSEA